MAKNQRLDATITIGSVLQKSVGKNLNVIRSGLDSVGDEIKRVTDRQRELSKQRRVLERQGKSVDALDREYEQLGRTLEDLRRKQERFERAQRAANRVGRDFGRMTSNIGRLARNASLAIGATGAAVFGLASSTASAGDEFAKQSRALGFNVEAYQELQYAAERSGVSVGTFNSSMTAFSKRLGEAAQGSGAAKDALEQMGLSAKDLVKMEPDKALELIADRLKDIDSPAERAAIAADLFSRAGVRMTGMLMEGKDGIRDLRQEARDLGLVLSEDTTTASETYQDSLLNAQSAVKGLKNTIGGALIPVVTRAMDDFTAFMKSNRADVELFAEKVATGLGKALPVIGDVARGIGDVAGKISTGVATLAEFVGGWENFGIIVGGILASKAIVSIGSFVGSVVGLGRAMWSLAPALPWVVGGIKAIGAAMVANPIGATIAVIALGAGLIISNWEAIKEFFAPLLNWLGEKFAWVMEKMKPMLDGLKWVAGKGMAAASAVSDFFGGGDNPAPGTAGNPYPDGHPMQKRAIGGAFRKGPLLVGERGPELRYERQGGYIAHNRSLERLAGLSDRVRSMGQQAGRTAAQVTQNITINATGMNPAELIDELERRKQEAQNDALFDGASDYGQYGGAYG
ncbi:phage tail tape measure protein [Roseovarius pacificus]|uniref:phage tail tape measure protein n=1 Tax=Roseovarius pacificus TaxID=337701 RepID=UPI002A18A2BC|nr:phage tail tape measure protein [Roseovarius pacificus]